MKPSIKRRELRASDLLFATSAVIILISGVASSAFAGTGTIKSAIDCVQADKDSAANRTEAQLGAKFRVDLERYIETGKAACLSGDFAAADAAYDMVRGMASAE